MMCPKCNKEFTTSPALSRVDNKTYICSSCGTKEALDIAFNNGAMSKEDADNILEMITNSN